MNEFKLIDIGDRELLTSLLLPTESQDCDLSFANLFTWHFQTASSYAVLHGVPVIRFSHPEEGHEYLLPPLGETLLPVVEELKERARLSGERLCLRGSAPELQQLLEGHYPSQFEYRSDRDYYDYLYNRLDLAELKGKHYQPKRNHVNRFRKSYDCLFEPLTPSCIPECLEFEAAWCRRHGYAESQTIRDERKSLTIAFRHWEELGLTGEVIRLEGRIIAFTFGHPINHNTFGVHYEKADIGIDGAYSAINRHFAASLPPQYTYLNREEDLGIPGLRQAKLSYHPVKLLEKTRAILNP